MKIYTVMPFYLLLAVGMSQACAQETGSISGTVYGPYEDQVRYAAIQATNVKTGKKIRSQSTRDGAYEISDLARGSYTLKINMPCCAYQPYESEEIEVFGAARFEIQLEEGTSFNTVGDDPGVIAAIIKDRQTIPDEPMPRLLDGTPDLSGVWLVGEDPFPQEANALPWAKELFDERLANDFGDHPHIYCLPGDPPITSGASPTIAKFLHKNDLLVILFEDSPGFRQIFVDGREHPEWPNPSWMGHSIGHWEDDILVVDTLGFNDRGWMSGYPRSEELHIIERYKRTDYGRMELKLTIEDPKVFNNPWTKSIVLDLAPQEELIEFVCENNRWAKP